MGGFPHRHLLGTEQLDRPSLATLFDIAELRITSGISNDIVRALTETTPIQQLV